MSTAEAPSAADLVRSRGYLGILFLCAVVGAPVAAISYFFLSAVHELQLETFTTLPEHWGQTARTWWPLPVLVVAGLLVALVIKYLPGTGGHEPVRGFSVGGTAAPVELPGIVLAAFVSLGLGAVLGPEGPLIALGGGLAAWAVRLAGRGDQQRAVAVMSAAGAFAAVSTLLGSPLVGAFLLMEVAGLGGPMLGVLLLPGLLASGIGWLIFIGLGDVTGLGTFSLSVTKLPPASAVTISEFCWAIVVGLLAAGLGSGIMTGARRLQPVVARHRLLLTPAAGAVVALAAILFGTLTTQPQEFVLLSGQTALDPLIASAATWSVGALVLVVVLKGLAYLVSLAGFRGGAVFPGIFIGAAGGMALSHLPGLSLVAGVAIGITGMTVAMIRLPLSAVLLTSLLLAADVVTLMPLIIVTAVVAYVAVTWISPPAPETPHN